MTPVQIAIDSITADRAAELLPCVQFTVPDADLTRLCSSAVSIGNPPIVGPFRVEEV